MPARQLSAVSTVLSVGQLTLAGDHVHDEAEEDPSAASVSKELEIVVCDISPSEDIQLGLGTTTSNVDGE